MEYKEQKPIIVLTDWILDLFYLFQNLFSKIISAFPSFMLFISRRFGNSHVLENGWIIISLDCLIFFQKKIWQLLNFSFKTYSFVSGYSSDKWFEKLVNWNSSISLRGFAKEKPFYIIDGLFKESDKAGADLDSRKWRELDQRHYSGLRYMGKFRILQKNVSKQSAIPDTSIDCIWISGKHSGLGFTLSRLSNFSPPAAGPAVIHFPPKFLIPFLLVFVSMATLDHLMKISGKIFHLFKH